MAFQTFFVSKAKDPMNIGRGIYLLCPNADRVTWLYEYPPHYFNRIRERLIEPRGINQPTFNNLVREVIRMHETSMNVIIQDTKLEEGEYLTEDEMKQFKRKDGYENFITYHQEGVSLGLSVDSRYFHYTTFVNNDKLREGQRNMQARIQKELRELAQKRTYDPTVRIDVQETIKDRDF